MRLHIFICMCIMRKYNDKYKILNETHSPRNYIIMKIMKHAFLKYATYLILNLKTLVFIE